METIRLELVEITPEILSFLEKRNLVKTLKPSPEALRYKKRGCRVEKIYETSPRFGTHKLICVSLNSQEIKLSSHPDNEEFIILNTTAHTFKPLYLIIALHKHRILERKARNKNLSADDFIALRLRYNHPQTSIFTLLKDTVHCEITPAGKRTAPVFFVAEPSRLTINYANVSRYAFSLDSI